MSKKYFSEAIAERASRISNMHLALSSMGGDEFSHEERLKMISKHVAEIADLATICISEAVYPLIILNDGDTEKALGFAKMIMEHAVNDATQRAKDFATENSQRQSPS